VIHDRESVAFILALGTAFTTDDGHVRISRMNETEAALWQATYAGQCNPCLLRRDIARWPDAPEFAVYWLTAEERDQTLTSQPLLPLRSVEEVMKFLVEHGACEPPAAVWPR
jgi:hypothetical protein